MLSSTKRAKRGSSNASSIRSDGAGSLCLGRGSALVAPSEPSLGAFIGHGAGLEETDWVVRFSGVSKSFNGAQNVVDDLNLQVRRGEFLTLLGPSGSGKTTSLMMLAGFEDFTAGDILIDGQSMRGVPPYRRNIGMVFQNYALFPHLTIAENLSFPLEARHMSRSEIRARVGQSLDMVQLGGRRGGRPSSRADSNSAWRSPGRSSTGPVWC